MITDTETDDLNPDNLACVWGANKTKPSILGTSQQDKKQKKTTACLLLSMEEILHQLRLVGYPVNPPENRGIQTLLTNQQKHPSAASDPPKKPPRNGWAQRVVPVDGY